MCPHRRLPVSVQICELIVGPIASGSAFPAPSVGIAFSERRLLDAILIPTSREVKKEFQSSTWLLSEDWLHFHAKTRPQDNRCATTRIFASIPRN